MHPPKRISAELFYNFEQPADTASCPLHLIAGADSDSDSDSVGLWTGIS